MSVSPPRPASGSPPGRTPSPGALLLAGAGLIALLVGMADAVNFTVDDTFIPLRYAENFARGQGLVFNPGERVEGYSNFLWTLLLSWFARGGVNQTRSDLALVVAAKAMGALCGLATLALTAWLVGRIARRRDWGEHSWLAWSAVLGLGTTYSFAIWSMSGMETPLCALLVTAGIAFTFVGLRASGASARPDRRYLLAGGVAFGLASLTRPEPVVVWALALGATIGFAPPAARRELLFGAIPTLAILAGFLVWRHAYYGTWIPNSVVAKFGGGAMAALLGAKYTLSSLIGSVGIVGFGFLGLPGVVRGRLDWTFMAAICVAYVLFSAVSGGDWMPGCRFLVPALPAFWLLGSAGIAETTRRLQPRVSPWSAATIILVLAAGAFAGERFLVRAQMEFPTGLKQITWVGSPERVAIAKELRGMIPAGSTLALGECGFVPYFNPDLRILDLYGLTDPRIARMRGMHTYKMTAAYFLTARPAYYLMMVKRQSQGAGVVSVPSHPDGVTLLASSAFQSQYEPIRSYSGFVLYRRRT